jgi:fructokinase
MIKHNIVCIGEILWDVLPGKELPGGAPLNVAYHLQKLSQQVAMVSAIGQDEKGARLLQLMESMQLTAAYIQKHTGYATGVVNAHMNEQQDMQYDIHYPAAWDHIGWNAALEALLQQDDVQYLVFGSLAARHAVSRQTMEKALQTNAVKVLDINLRTPWYTQETLEWLLRRCQLLKLNVAELALISSWYGAYDNNEARILAIAKRFNIRSIIVTLGSKGCMGYIAEQFYYQPVQPVTVADTIGSGDAFLAGFLACSINGCAPAYSLAYANALGALVASRPGGCPDYDPAEIMAMIQQPAIIHH